MVYLAIDKGDHISIYPLDIMTPEWNAGVGGKDYVESILRRTTNGLQKGSEEYMDIIRYMDVGAWIHALYLLCIRYDIPEHETLKPFTIPTT